MNANASSQAGGRSAWIANLLSARGVMAIWIAYGVLNAAVRIAFGRTLTLDDARASELVQTLALGYQARNPPLWEWLLWGSQQVFGPGIESHLVVRFLLIAVLGIATFYAARRVIGDDRWAALASLSMLATDAVGWRFHDWATQTILLCIACVVTLDAALRHLQRPSWGSAALLGAAVGFGMMAKFSYPIFLLSLLLAVLSMPDMRQRLKDRRLLVVPVVAAVLAAPYLAWLAASGGSVFAGIKESVIDAQRSYGLRVLHAFGQMLFSLSAFALQWLLLAALVIWPVRLWQAPERPPGLGERLSARTLGFAVLLASAGAILLGASNIGARYMYSILFILPIWLFARLARYRQGEGWVRRFAIVAVAALVLFPFARVAMLSVPALGRGGMLNTLLPYPELAAALRQRGVVEGTAVTPNVRLGGNLRAFIPDLRIVSSGSFRLIPPPRRASDDRSCVFVGTDGELKDARLTPAEMQKRERLDITQAGWGLHPQRTLEWWMVRLDPSSDACR